MSSTKRNHLAAAAPARGDSGSPTVLHIPALALVVTHRRALTGLAINRRNARPIADKAIIPATARALWPARSPWREKGSHTFSRTSALMPLPVSLTESSHLAPAPLLMSGGVGLVSRCCGPIVSFPPWPSRPRVDRQIETNARAGWRSTSTGHLPPASTSLGLRSSRPQCGAEDPTSPGEHAGLTSSVSGRAVGGAKGPERWFQRPAADRPRSSPRRRAAAIRDIAARARGAATTPHSQDGRVSRL